jgi:hypothetical protein
LGAIANGSLFIQPSEAGETFLSVRSSLVSPILNNSSGGSNGDSGSSESEEEDPDFSGDGRPGSQTAGDGRGACQIPVDRPLTALIPQSNWGQTTAARPTFWVYVPYSEQEMPVGEFVLQKSNREDVYRVPFTLDGTPGLVPVQLPDTAPALQPGESYRWYFKVYCSEDKTNVPLFVQGWVQRIAASKALQQELAAAGARQYQVFADRGLWYDALSHLARLQQQNPHNRRLQQAWQRLLGAQGVDLDVPPPAATLPQVVLGSDRS